MRKLLITILGLLLLPGACGQLSFSPAPKLTVSGVTGGASLGLVVNTYLPPPFPAPENRLYADDTIGWPPQSDAYPTRWHQADQIRTLSADEDSTGNTTLYSFTIDTHARVTVWHDDAQTTKPTWLTNTYLDAGEDALLSDDPEATVTASGWAATFAAGTYNLGGNCPVAGCTGTPKMYVVSILPAWAPGNTTPGAPATGSVSFASSSYTGNESTNLTFQATRIGGTDGACSVVVAEGTNPSNGVLNTFSLSWASGESGSKSGNVDLASVTVDSTMTLDLSSPSGCVLGSTTSTTITITDTTPPSAAQTYYVRATDGNDADDGLSSGNAWLTIGRANSVTAHASGDVDIVVQGGQTYRGTANIWAPQNSGTNSTHKIRLTTDGNGVVSMRGPASGSIDNMMIFEGVAWIEVVRPSATSYIEIDGEVVFGSGAGEVEQNEDVASFGHVASGILIGAETGGDSNDISLDLNHKRVPGWSGVGIWPGSENIILRINSDQTGSPWNIGGDDWGDWIYIGQDHANDERILFDGGATGRYMNRGGHAGAVMYGATGALRGYTMDGMWGGVISTFSAGRGNRNTQFGGRNALDWHAYNVIFQRSGQPADQAREELTKIEGRRTSISDCVGRNSDHNVFEISTAPWSWKARSLRVSHCVFDNIPGLIVSLRDYFCLLTIPGEWPTHATEYAQPDDIRLYNLILKNVATANEVGANYLLDINLCSGDWQDVIFMHGITVEDSTKDGDDFLIWIGGAGGPGSHTVNWYIQNYPANFSNWTFTTDANLDNAPAYASDVSLTNMLTEYGPVSDSLSTGTGVDLTTTTAAGTGSVNLCVNDITWFDDPVDGAPGFGQQSEGFYVHLEGAGNVQYTAISRDAYPQIDGCFTLSSAQTWASGADVNKKITSGGANDNPNRGVVR